MDQIVAVSVARNISLLSLCQHQEKSRVCKRRPRLADATSKEKGFPSFFNAQSAIFSSLCGSTAYCLPNLSREYDRIYEANQAYNQMKFDIWRARHRNVHLVGDLSPFILFLTYVRDAKVSGKEFVCYADLLMRFLLSHAYSVLPRVDQTLVTTTSGYKFKGTKLDRDKNKMVAFVLTTESHPEWLRPFAEVLGACFPGASVGELSVSWPDEWEPDVVWRWHTPSPKKRLGLKGGLQLQGCTTVLFCPIVATGYSAEIAVKKIIAAGTEPKNIVLTSIVMSMEGLTYLSEQFPMIKFVVGEIDPEIDSEGLCVPGMGDFVGRYMDYVKGLQMP